MKPQPLRWIDVDGENLSPDVLMSTGGTKTK